MTTTAEGLAMPKKSHCGYGAYADREPRETPAYTVLEAVRYLRIPERTLHNWMFGRYYPVRDGGQRRAQALVEAADPTLHLLSFVNMIELHVLDAIRNVHGLNMRVVRRALTFLQDELGLEHPLAYERMETDGKTILIRRLNTLVDAGGYGQTSMLEMLDVQLARIEHDAAGLAAKLFPFTRRKPRDLQQAIGEPRLIAMDPAIAFGRPVIAGSRIPTAEIADRYKAGDSMSELATDYGRPQAEIEEAVRCELSLDAA